jgi:uncharacterized protein (DUF427 family)
LPEARLREVSSVTRAVFNGKTIAESATTQTVDGYTYFPPDAVHWEYLRPSATISVCHWKGEASYYSVVMETQTEVDAAWCYENPKPAATAIKGHVGFWGSVKIVID